MADSLLQVKQDFKKFDQNWSEKLLSRHSLLKSKYSYPLDQKRFLAQNQDLIKGWFDLYLSIKAQYGILDKDTYNIDENSYMIGIAENSKVVFSKY